MKTIRTEITGIGDPFVLLHDGTYYMYATTSPEGFKVYSSDDLREWEDRGLCYIGKNGFGYECFWAPEVVKRADGRFVMHFTAREERSKSLRIGVAVSDSPLGPFEDYREKRPMFDHGYAVIDSHCFTDKDGKSYLLYVRDVSENICTDGIRRSQIYIAPLNDELTELVGEGKMLLSPSGEQETSTDPLWQWNEGPFVLLHNGKYYLNYSYNCFDMREYSVGVAVSDNIMGPYEKVDRDLLRPEEGDFSGPGHNAYFRTKEGRLFCSFHIHTNPAAPSGDRRACFREAMFTEEGKLVLIP